VEDIVAAARSIAVLSKADLSRVRHNHGIGDDRAAVRFVVDEVIEDFVRRGQLVRDGNGGVSLKFRRVASLRYQDSKVPLNEPVEEGINKSPDGRELYGPFNKSFGDFKDGTREDLGDLTELTASMRAFGWIDAVGRAIRDEHEVVLVGHRRLEVAKRLGITQTTEGNPLTVMVDFGPGNDADAARVAVALAADLGRASLKAPDRRKICQRLHADSWSMDNIAQALGVSQSTVQTDIAAGELSTLSSAGQSECPKKPPRRKRSDGPTPEQVRRVIELHVDGDMGCNRAATEVGLGHGTVWKIGKKELERRASLEQPEPEKEQDQEEPKTQGEATMPAKAEVEELEASAKEHWEELKETGEATAWTEEDPETKPCPDCDGTGRIAARPR
jgi:transposase